jgi:HEAT repeat protein
MNAYAPPVSTLLKLGGPPGDAETADYKPYGIGPEHVPELIRLLQDNELASGDSETPEVYAQVHAWRALGQLRAPEAVEPLLDLLATQEGENWSDWTTEEVPRVLGRFGPSIIPAIVARLEQRGQQEWVPIYFAMALTEIAKRHLAARSEVIAQLCRVLHTARHNDPNVNGNVIANLIELKAVEAWPAIEAAYATDHVDLGVTGEAAKAKWELGLGPKPPPRLDSPLRARIVSGPTAKDRADARAKQRKAEKRKDKKKRKGN